MIHGKPIEPVIKINPDMKDVMSFEVVQHNHKALLDAEYINTMAKARSINQHQIEMPTTNKKTLIISRKLGFKKMRSGLGQWKMLTTPNEECWICG
jgi:hypothetical protein